MNFVEKSVFPFLYFILMLCRDGSHAAPVLFGDLLPVCHLVKVLQAHNLRGVIKPTRIDL